MDGTEIKRKDNLETYLFNELRCVEPFWSITSQITQLHAATLITCYTRVPKLSKDRNEYETCFKCVVSNLSEA